ncbi:MAG TPA: SDR family oxidoreductase, partial [Aestuariivirga sp.]
YKVPADNIIAGTREPAKLADFKAKGVHIRDSDFNDEAALTKSFAGVTRLLIISTNSMEPGVRLKQHLNAVHAAEKAGVKHVIYTSMPRPDTSAVLFAPDHLNTEKALAAAKIDGYTVLRNNWYYENLFHALPQALQSGMQYSAAGQGKMAHIGRDDLARAAASVLASDTGGKNTYTLSGAKEYTTDEIAKLVSAATGKPLKVIQVPVEGLIHGMIGAGLPEGMARMLASFDVNTAQGGLTGNAADFKKLTGIEPHSFEDWLKKNVAAFTAPAAH